MANPGLNSTARLYEYSTIPKVDGAPWCSSDQSPVTAAASDSRLKLIIGIDYGTSHTGAAYALHTRQSKDLPEIEVIRDWPQHGSSAYRQASEKVLSDIAYDANNQARCGFDIPLELERLQWVKLLLEPHLTNPNLGHGVQTQRTLAILERMNKSPIDVAADYLGWLWNHVRSRIIENESNEDIFKIADTTIVITVPAVWSEKARDNTVLAVERAGIGLEGRTIKFVTEPEAAAIFSLRNKARTGQIKKEDCVILCDSGGGTVDVVSYQVRGTDPLVLDQCVVGDGDLCGSIFINIEFQKQLEGLLGDDMGRLSRQAKEKISEDFEYDIKRNYSSQSNNMFFIDLPGLADNATFGIRNGNMKIDPEILSMCFETVMTQTMTLIDKQRDGLKSKNLEDKLKIILLVGGFGGSKFLRERINQEYFADQAITVWPADRSWTSIARGAVLCEFMGLKELKPVNIRLSRWNYGTLYNTKFDELTHNQEDWYKCSHTGVVKARDQIQWFVRKGTEVYADTKFPPYEFTLVLTEAEYHAGETIAWDVTLVRSDEDNAPERRTPAVKCFVDIRCRFESSVLNTAAQKLQDHAVWKLKMLIEMTAGPALLSFRCLVNGNEVGTANVSYRDSLG